MFGWHHQLDRHEFEQAQRSVVLKQKKHVLYSCLENPMDRGAWQATVHRVAKSQTRLSDVTFTFTIVFFRYHTSPSLLELFLILHYFIETS